MRYAQCGVATPQPEAHHDAPKAWALDMDRMLGDTAVVMAGVMHYAPKFGVRCDVIDNAKKEDEEAGRTFPVFNFIEKRLTDKHFDDFVEAFAEDPTPIVYDDTYPFLSALQATGEPWLIPTFGENVLFQYIKARRLGVPVYVECMPHTRKGIQMATWRGNGETYDFRGLDAYGNETDIYHAPTQVLVDDKDKSHADLEPAPRARGYVLKRPGKRLMSQSSGIPAHVQDRVTEITSLDQITEVREAAANPSVQTATCNPVSTGWAPGASAPAVAFRPAYPRGNVYPGLFITPNMPLHDLREAAALHAGIIASLQAAAPIH